MKATLIMDEQYTTKLIYLFAQKMMNVSLTEFEVLLYESLCRMTTEVAKLHELAARLSCKNLEKGETDGNAC